jgi:hypothetical protein
VLKRKAAPEEPVQPKKKGGGTSRVPKRLKVELQNNGVCAETAQKQAPKGLVLEMFLDSLVHSLIVFRGSRVL